jgi:hypothetical protein
VPRLRAVLVAVPPLLADIIRQALIGRAGVWIIAEIAEPENALARLRDLAPDVVVVGPAAAPPSPTTAGIRFGLPQARVLALSPDLTRILGPAEGDVSEFTPAALAQRLRLPRD